MKNEDKTREQLIAELVELRRQNAGLDVALKQTESRTMASVREYVQDITDSSLDMIIVVDKDRMITEFNKAAQKTFGYNLEEVLGKNVDMLYDDPEEGLEVHKLIRETGQFSGELTNRRKNGMVFPSFVSASILQDSRNRFKGVMGISRDITERKWEEEERERLEGELRDKNRELEQLIYITSHDLRSPLLNIQGFTRELDSAIKHVYSTIGKAGLPAAVKEELASTLEEGIPEAIEYILAGVSRMDSLLSGLLRLSRLGSDIIAIRDLDMNKLISSIVEAFEFQIRETNATVQIDKLLPCRGDVAQINQLFSNLLDNALKYLDPDRPGIIRISCKEEVGKVVYCVEDNGIGIVARHQDKIFEIFHRIDSMNEPGEGLGLAIARRIMDRHNGKIYVESQRGVGSKFFISLLNLGDI